VWSAPCTTIGVGSFRFVGEVELPEGDTKLKAFDFVKDWAIQLITLASAILVLSATFYKDISSGAPVHRWLLEWSWFLLFLSILAGISVLGALSYELNEALEAKTLDVYRANVCWTALAEASTFWVAVGLFVLFIFLNMPNTRSTAVPTTANLNGSVMANGPVTATGPISAGSVTATGSITATGPITIRGTVNSNAPHKIRGRKRTSSQE
jgi:hypothetical protein